MSTIFTLMNSEKSALKESTKNIYHAVCKEKVDYRHFDIPHRESDFNTSPYVTFAAIYKYRKLCTVFPKIKKATGV